MIALFYASCFLTMFTVEKEEAGSKNEVGGPEKQVI